MGYPLSAYIPETGLSIDQVSDYNTLDIGRMTSRSRPAQELSKWAGSLGREDKFHDAVFDACYVRNRDIGDIDHLEEMAESAGLPGKAVKEVLSEGRFRMAVDNDWRRSLTVDPQYIPSVLLGEDLLVNPQKYSLFKNLMKTHCVPKR